MGNHHGWAGGQRLLPTPHRGTRLWSSLHLLCSITAPLFAFFCSFSTLVTCYFGESRTWSALWRTLLLLGPLPLIDSSGWVSQARLRAEEVALGIHSPARSPAQDTGQSFCSYKQCWEQTHSQGCTARGYTGGTDPAVLSPPAASAPPLLCVQNTSGGMYTDKSNLYVSGLETVDNAMKDKYCAMQSLLIHIMCCCFLFSREAQ